MAARSAGLIDCYDGAFSAAVRYSCPVRGGSAAGAVCADAGTVSAEPACLPCVEVSADPHNEGRNKLVAAKMYSPAAARCRLTAKCTLLERVAVRSRLDARCPPRRSNRHYAGRELRSARSGDFIRVGWRPRRPQYSRRRRIGNQLSSFPPPPPKGNSLSVSPYGVPLKNKI
jgi:hypothetical protein